MVAEGCREMIKKAGHQRSLADDSARLNDLDNNGHSDVEKMYF